jgi:hypothetical protein
MDQADAELLERTEQGDHVFRPGSGEPARRGFGVLVGHLRELRDHGLLDMPERSVSQSESGESSAAGAYLLAGPCDVTDPGRAALDTFRRRDRRDRRAGDRHQADRRLRYDPSVIPPGGDCRGSDRDRRQGDRRYPSRRSSP